MTPLCKLAAKYGTDKLRHGYTELYDRLFSHLRDQPICLVEIGVFKGGSVRMWQEYFPKATIYVIDKSADRLRSLHGTGVCRILGDTSNPTTFDAIDRPVNIVVDDGSHIPEHQIIAWEKLWPLVVKGGYFSVEDLHAPWAIENGRHAFVDYVTNVIVKNILEQSVTGQPTDFHFYQRLMIARKT